MEPGFLHHQNYAPQGVPLHIVPCNFPLILGFWTIPASLAVANGVVLKGPLSAIFGASAPPRRGIHRRTGDRDGLKLVPI
ncbi:aldehyde dehydrogenase family protein [Sagittula sp. NFXS13]